MGDVIHPAFGRPQVVVLGPGGQIPNFTLLQSYGELAGHVVGLARTGSGTEPTALIVLVGPIGSGAGVAVATLPDTAAGEVEAERVALAILQTLMIVEGTYRPWEGASS